MESLKNTFHPSVSYIKCSNSNRRCNKNLHNLEVKHNRDIIKRLIDCTFFLSFQNLAFRGHDESESSLNKGNFKELMSFLSKYDPNLKTFLDNNFSGTSKTIQNEILERK
jgi:hypothetical protein